MDINHFQALNVASLIPEANPAFCHIQYARTGRSGIFSHASDISIERMVARKGLIVRGSQQHLEQNFKVTHQTHPASRGDCFTQHAHMRKNTRLSLHFCIASDEKLGRGLE